MAIAALQPAVPALAQTATPTPIPRATPIPTTSPLPTVRANISVDRTVIDYGQTHVLTVYGEPGSLAELSGNGRLIRQAIIKDDDEVGGAYVWELKPGNTTTYSATVNRAEGFQQTRSIIVRVRRTVTIGVSQANGVYTFTGSVNKAQGAVQVTIARLDPITKRVTGVIATNTDLAGNYAVRTRLPIGQAGYYALLRAQSGLEANHSRLYGLVVPRPAPAVRQAMVIVRPPS